MTTLFFCIQGVPKMIELFSKTGCPKKDAFFLYIRCPKNNDFFVFVVDKSSILNYLPVSCALIRSINGIYCSHCQLNLSEMILTRHQSQVSESKNVTKSQNLER